MNRLSPALALLLAAICLLPIWLLAVALSVFALIQKIASEKGRLLSRYLALLIGLWGGAMLLGAAGGAKDPLRPLAFVTATAAPVQTAAPDGFMAGFTPIKTEQDFTARVAEAGKRGQWTLVDYYADWCVSCKAIEHEVFADPRVQAALADVQLLRPDVTANDAEDRALMSAHQVLGPPTLLLIGPDGKERRAQRIVGELSADAFLARLAQARKS